MRPPLAETELPRSVREVIAEARRFLQPEAILLFGSRARGAASSTSDFDFAFVGVKDNAAWSRFCNYVQYDAPTLFGIDLVRYEHASPKLRHRIDDEGRKLSELDAP